MKVNVKLPAIVSIVILILTSCGQDQQVNQPTVTVIAISKASPVENYTSYFNWLKSADSNVSWVDMYSLGIDSAVTRLATCDGLLLTGGEDIYPGLYNLEFDSVLCDEPNRHRDSLETRLLHEAIRLGLPVMGICRGMQMINVSLGGTLYFDLPVQKDTLVRHRNPGYKPAHHEVTITDGSILAQHTGTHEGNVYSNHHQGIRKLAPGLLPIAFSADSLIESVQYTNTSGKPFFLGVQWHPEKMEYSDPLSNGIAMVFVENAKKHAQK